jgi:hypothetical protein
VSTCSDHRAENSIRKKHLKIPIFEKCHGFELGPICRTTVLRPTVPRAAPAAAAAGAQAGPQPQPHAQAPDVNGRV